MNVAAWKPTTRGIVSRTGSQAVRLFFLAAAALFAATTLCAIINFGFRQPMFDQWREYETLLGLPFPQDLVQLDNGHRPIVPNLIRVAEIRWFGANQILQLTIGTICAYLTALILAAAAWREREQPPIARAIGVMLAVLGMLWLGNARRLLHGSESLHGYVPTLATLLACACVVRASTRHSPAWLWIASLACACATFSFGVGMASFPAVVACMILLRMPSRWLLVPAFALAACLVLYLYLLPGNQGVRSQIDIDPVAGMHIAAQWISAPWVNGWLDYAQQLAAAPPPPDHAWIRSVVGGSATFVVGTLGGSEDIPAFVIGTLGVLLFCLWLVSAMRRRGKLARVELLAAGTAIYALAGAAITSFSRIEYFQQHPEQTFADRYMTWPCLFWASIAILALFRYAKSGSAIIGYGGTVVFATLPVALWVTQVDNAVWGAIVFRSAQQTAAQLRSGLYDPAHFPAESLGAETELRQIALLRRNRLAMFGDPSWQRLGTAWTGSLQHDARIKASVHWLDQPTDGAPGTGPAHCEGWIAEGNKPAHQLGMLVLLDQNRVISGFGEFSFISPVSKALILRLPKKRGFDCYVESFDANTTYTLVLLNFNGNAGFELKSLPPPALLNRKLGKARESDRRISAHWLPKKDTLIAATGIRH
jgi:hypothetical protein